jgi:hypothetical protein
VKTEEEDAKMAQEAAVIGEKLSGQWAAGCGCRQTAARLKRCRFLKAGLAAANWLLSSPLLCSCTVLSYWQVAILSNRRAAANKTRKTKTFRPMPNRYFKK